MPKVVAMERASLRELVEEIEKRGPAARGVIAIICDNDGPAHFRISGFTGKSSSFIVLGLLDWVKADLLKDITA